MLKRHHNDLGSSTNLAVQNAKNNHGSAAPVTKRTKLTPGTDIGPQSNSLNISALDFKRLLAVRADLGEQTLTNKIGVIRQIATPAYHGKIAQALAANDVVNAWYLLFTCRPPPKKDTHALDALHQNNLGQFESTINVLVARSTQPVTSLLVQSVINFRQVVSAELVPDRSITFALQKSCGHRILSEVMLILAADPVANTESAFEQLLKIPLNAGGQQTQMISKNELMRQILSFSSRSTGDKVLGKLRQRVSCGDALAVRKELHACLAPRIINTPVTTEQRAVNAAANNNKPNDSPYISNKDFEQLGLVYSNVDRKVLREKIKNAFTVYTKCDQNKITAELAKNNPLKAWQLIFTCKPFKASDEGALALLRENKLSHFEAAINRKHTSRTIFKCTLAWSIVNFRQVVSEKLVPDDYINKLFYTDQAHLALISIIEMLAADPVANKLSEIDQLIATPSYDSDETPLAKKSKLMQHLIIFCIRQSGRTALKDLREKIKCSDADAAGRVLLAYAHSTWGKRAAEGWHANGSATHTPLPTQTTSMHDSPKTGHETAQPVQPPAKAEFDPLAPPAFDPELNDPTIVLPSLCPAWTAVGSQTQNQTVSSNSLGENWGLDWCQSL